MIHERKFAFTIIEMVIVLMVIGVVLSATTSGYLAIVRYNTIKKTRVNLDNIKSALDLFVLKNSRLPCPAPLNTASSNVGDGNEVGTAGTCGSAGFGDGVYDGALDTNGGYDSNNLVFGAVPYKVLGLSELVAKDHAGNKISYAVDVRYTKDDSTNKQGFLYMSDTISAVGDNLITIKSQTDTTPISAWSDITKDAIFALISHGGNRKAAYEFSTGIQPVGVANSAGTLGEQSEYTNSPIAAFDAMFVKQMYKDADQFDDIVLYQTRRDIVNSMNLQDITYCNTADSSSVQTVNGQNYTITWPTSQTSDMPIKGYDSLQLYCFQRHCGDKGKWINNIKTCDAMDNTTPNIDPKTIPNNNPAIKLVLWLDAADPSTIVFDTANSLYNVLTKTLPVKTWKDKSGNGNDVVQNTNTVQSVGFSLQPHYLPLGHISNKMKVGTMQFVTSRSASLQNTASPVSDLTPNNKDYGQFFERTAGLTLSVTPTQQAIEGGTIPASYPVGASPNVSIFIVFWANSTVACYCGNNPNLWNRGTLMNQGWVGNGLTPMNGWDIRYGGQTTETTNVVYNNIIWKSGTSGTETANSKQAYGRQDSFVTYNSTLPANNPAIVSIIKYDGLVPASGTATAIIYVNGGESNAALGGGNITSQNSTSGRVLLDPGISYSAANPFSIFRIAHPGSAPSTTATTRPVFFDGQISEIIIYQGALSGKERRQIETYLRNKYLLF